MPQRIAAMPVLLQCLSVLPQCLFQCSYCRNIATMLMLLAMPFSIVAIRIAAILKRIATMLPLLHHCGNAPLALPQHPNIFQMLSRAVSQQISGRRKKSAANEQRSRHDDVRRPSLKATTARLCIAENLSLHSGTTTGFASFMMKCVKSCVQGLCRAHSA